MRDTGEEFFDFKRVKKALSDLEERYGDDQVKNNAIVFGTERDRFKMSERKFECCSMKRLRVKHSDFENCEFVSDAFNGSIFERLRVENSKIEGNSFACCDFTEVAFKNSVFYEYKGNNFSQSNFSNCVFNNVKFRNSSAINTLYLNSTFENIIFKSCTLESARFKHCAFSDVNASGTNIEFATFSDCKFKNTFFPFYQFAYIIGAADILKSEGILLKSDEKEISAEEYLKETNNLLAYYYSLSEYFPMCNIYIMLDDLEKAKKCVKNGIGRALESRDFRRIKYFCQIGKYYGLFDFDLTKFATEAIDTFLIKENFNDYEQNLYLVHSGEIRSVLDDANRGNSRMQIEIKTNVNANDESGRDLINELSEAINSAVAECGIPKESFSVTVSSHSPFAITCTVIGLVANIVYLSEAIYKAVKNVKVKDENLKDKKRRIRVDIEKRYKALEALSAEEKRQNIVQIVNKRLRELKKEVEKDFTEKRFNAAIEKITQKIIGDTGKEFDKNLLIFRVDAENK